MKAIVLVLSAVSLTSCATVVRSDGTTQSVLTPIGSQIVQGVAGTAVGAGVGWAVQGDAEGALTGALSSGAGQLAGGLLGTVLPTERGQ